MSHAIKRPSFLRLYGAIFIFLVMWIGTGIAHYHNARDAAVHEAQEHGQEFEESQFRTEWLRDTFENHQSEYAQLFFQTLFIIALARYIFYKEERDFDEIKDMIERRNE